jgi:hypothetical protein
MRQCTALLMTIHVIADFLEVTALVGDGRQVFGYRRTSISGTKNNTDNLLA